MRTEYGYIINKCLNGEKEAFGFLVDKYKSSVYAFAYSKLWNFHDAEDITQEVFIKAFRKLHTLKRWDSFLAWLYSITSNLCKNFIRSKFNRPDHEFIAEQEPGTLSQLLTNSYREEQVTARGFLSTSAVNGNIYAIGGLLNPNVSLSTVEEYDPTTDTWTKKADMLTARCALSTNVVNGYIYAIGGAPNLPAPQFPIPALSIVEAYDTGFRAVEPEGKLPTTWGRMKVVK